MKSQEAAAIKLLREFVGHQVSFLYLLHQSSETEDTRSATLRFQDCGPNYLLCLFAIPFILSPMSIFDRFLRRAAQADPDSPSALREHLFAAVHSGDDAALTRLCAQHEASIIEHFPAWQKVPDEVRRDRARLQRYGNGLVGIAQCLAESRDRPELLQRLMGRDPDNPIVRLQETLRRASTLMDMLDFEGALELLVPEAERSKELSGGSADSMMAMILGKIATCHCQSDRAEVALPLFRQALELCRTARDQEGIVAYLGSLFEAHRYLGQGAEAARVAAEYARELQRAGEKDQARRVKAIADVVRRGEPLNRVVVDIAGTIFELDDLPRVIDGNLRFIFCRNRIGLARAEAHVQRGRELAEDGRFEEALALFRDASVIDPHAPEPHYEGAVTLLHLERASEAVAWYDQVEALAPGWYHCRAERWLAAGIAEGRIPHMAFTILRKLESPNMTGKKGIQLARRGIREAPGVPEFQLHLGRQLLALGRNDEAREAFAAGMKEAEEPDIRSRLLIESVAFDPPSPERDRKLREAIAPGGNLVAAAMATVMLRTGNGPDSPN